MQSVLAVVSSVQLEAERVYSVVSEHRNYSRIHNIDTDPHIPPLEASSLLPSSLATVAGLCSHLTLPMHFPTNAPDPSSGLFQSWGINSEKDLEDNKGMKQ